MGSPTLEEWAAQKALELDYDGGWMWLDAFSGGPVWIGHNADDEEQLTEEQARALLAFRDKTVAGLTDAQQRLLRPACRTKGAPCGAFPDSTADACLRKGIIHSVQGRVETAFRATAFGRECARVLRGGVSNG